MLSTVVSLRNSEVSDALLHRAEVMDSNHNAPVRLEAKITIQTPPESVWEIITDNVAV